MKTKNILNILSSSLVAAGTFSLSMSLSAAPGTVATQPLFTQNAVDPNIMLAIDDSGSMDFETLFTTNDGSLWWEDSTDTFIDGTIPYFNGDDKYVYIFPNGTGFGSGRRVLGDGTNSHFAIPPFTQFAFARSAAYNKSYYDPTVTYEPWISYNDQTFDDIDITAAPVDPFHDRDVASERFNLIQDIETNETNHRFRFQPDMVIPEGTRYHNGSTFVTAGADTPFGSETSRGVRYYPATYYTVVDTGTYDIRDLGGTEVDGDCASPNPAHYRFLEVRPSSLDADTGITVDSLGPDGRCLKETRITASDDDATKTNFANWFSYYRKRHLALRAGLPSAFNDITAVRVGMFTINDRNTVTMLDFDTNKDAVFNDIYEEAVGGGTPNRQALFHAGSQYERTGTGAPITDECQKNFTLFFTDGFNSNGANGTVGNADGGEGVPYADSYSGTLADIAMYYYERNLRPDLLPAGNVPVSDQCEVTPLDPKLDCNEDLHMVTYTVGLGAQGFVFNQTVSGNFYDEVSDVYDNPVVWPDTNASRDPSQIDDLYHAAVNGRGEIYNAQTPAELTSELKLALKSITEQTGSAAAVAFNTSVLSTGSVVYQARFNTDKWKGELLSFSLNPVSGAVAVTFNWDAGDLLPNDNGRNIISYNPESQIGAGPDAGIGVVFNTGGGTADNLSDSPLSSTAQADLNASLPTGRTAVDRLNYLRGDRTYEPTGDFRTRDDDTVLGDIVNSAPVFVGIPDQGWPDGDAAFPNGFPSGVNAYSTFAGTSRTSMVYVGANDGMLHAFNASTGAEVLAYVPHQLYSGAAGEGLHYLSDTGYQHAYYADGTPSIADVYTPGRTGTGSVDGIDWRTVLVGTLRGGGSGVYALDITNPSSFAETSSAAASTALWEFTDADDADLGLTFSRATIVPTHAVDGSGNTRWAAIIGNGYNNGGTCTASLFILFLDGGLDGDWSDADDYIKLDTEIGSAGDCNGLSSPRVIDADNDSIADRVYAGDLHGNMWTFDICNRDGQGNCQATGWDVAYSSGGGGGATPEPLFTAQDAGGNRQPITATPSVITHPTVLSGPAPNTMVLFGSGQYIVNADKDTAGPPSHTFYGVWDRGDSNLIRSDLFAQTFEAGFGVGADIRVTTVNEPDYSGGNPTHHGWYLDLPDTSEANNAATGAPERSVTNSVVIGDIVFFNTLVPTVDGCDVGGYGYLMSVLSKSGGRPLTSVFDVNADGDVDDSDLVTVSGDDVAAVGKRRDEGILSEPSFLGDKRYESTSKGKIIQDTTDPTGVRDTGRYSWQEIRDE